MMHDLALRVHASPAAFEELKAHNCETNKEDPV